MNEKGKRSFELEGICRFCYQTPDWMQLCVPVTACRKDSWVRLHKTNCTVDDNIVCLGARSFYKKIDCNWTTGYKWNVAMVLSVFFGGFGVDRFYLGLYKVGLFFVCLMISLFQIYNKLLKIKRKVSESFLASVVSVYGL